MPRTTATVSVQAIELKGSLLPGSLLEQVARLQAPQQKEADYGLAQGDLAGIPGSARAGGAEHGRIACLGAPPARGTRLAGPATLQRLATRRQPVPDHPPGV